MTSHCPSLAIALQDDKGSVSWMYARYERGIPLGMW
jgi:hypothetical protein